MENQEETKSTRTFFRNPAFVIAVLLLAALAAGVLMWQEWDKKSIQEENGSIQKLPVQKPVVKTFPADELPSGLPSDIPLEADAQVLRNERVTAEKVEGTEVQARRVFVSNRSVEENATLYLEYLTQNGWEVADSESPEGFVVLIGQKLDGAQILRIVIAKLEAPPGAEIALTGSEVDITFTELQSR